MIRPARKEDIKEIARIFLEENIKPPYNIKTDMEKSIRTIESYFENETIFVAEESRIAGFIIAFCHYWLHGNEVWISELFVSPDWQVKGIGRKLIEKVLDHFKEKDIKKISLMANKDAKAMKFYEKLGFKEFGSIRLFQKFIK
jgi:GNAT superfamily N-acetyltransferase